MVSTLSIRRQWLEEAIRETPDRPIFGHGVGMLVDETPEARVMGVYGQKTYPHNSLVEAAYSLGVVGLIPYLVFLASAATALVALVRRQRRDPSVAFALSMGVFAFVLSNISGEIATDALLWASAVLAVVLFADARRSTRAPS